MLFEAKSLKGGKKQKNLPLPPTWAFIAID